MRKEEIHKGSDYVVPLPHERRTGGVRATVVETDLDLGSGRRDGVRVRLRADTRRGTFDGSRIDRAGLEWVVRTSKVKRAWTIDDDEMAAWREYREQRAVELAERLQSLGLDRSTNDAIARLRNPAGVRDGFTVLGNRREVTIDIEAMLRWLNRIDPETIAGEAIDLFVTAVTEEVPWTGLADISPPTRERFKGVALREIREGVAVSDGDLTITNEEER